MMILADEVYQENIYTDKEFISVKKVSQEMGKPFSNLEIVSFHSASKGTLGE
jgi:alanine transaminase